MHDKMLDRALSSMAQKQSRNPDELVVVLDQCWEGTKERVESWANTNAATGDEWFGDVKIVDHTIKQGLAVAKNFGLEHVTGDYVTYCDADDEWLGCKLELQERFLLDNPDIDFCFTESWDRDVDGVVRPNCYPVGRFKTHEEIEWAIKHENVLCHGSAMIRTQALRDLGGYPTHVRCLGREDWALWDHAISKGYRFYKIPERLYIWSHGTSVDR
jgi:glycosyltransferase involved in cell wall biosynthesis